MSEELNKLMAKVAGIELMISASRIVYVPDNKCIAEDWNPTEDMNQAMMCLKKHFGEISSDTIDPFLEHLIGGEQKMDVLTKYGVGRVAVTMMMNPEEICKCIAKAIGESDE